jgi:hypothetical protein
MPIAPSEDSQYRFARGSGMVTDDEDPLPSLKRGPIVQALVHSCHHDTGEHATDLADGCEDSCSFRDFQWFARLCVSSCSLTPLLRELTTKIQECI